MTRHLTDDEHQALADLYDDCDPREFLLTVAGLVSHNVEPSWPVAEAAARLVRHASDLVVMPAQELDPVLRNTADRGLDKGLRIIAGAIDQLRRPVAVADL